MLSNEEYSVMLEVDTPGHSKSWGQAYKNMTVNFCTLNADSVPLNPTIPFTLDVVSGFINEMISGSNPIFPDEFIHLGGDEVDLNCWEKNKAIEEYMTKNHLTTATLLSQWISQVRKNVDDASNNNKNELCIGKMLLIIQLVLLKIVIIKLYLQYGKINKHFIQ